MRYFIFILFLTISGSIGAQSYNPKFQTDEYFLNKNYNKKEIDKYAQQWADHFDLDVNVVNSVIMQESSYRHTALSSKNAKGLMQLLPSTAKDKLLGMTDKESLFNPYTNIYYGCKYLKWLLSRYEGSYKYALIGYYSGPKWADRMSSKSLRDGKFKNKISSYAKEVLDRSLRYTEVLIGQNKETRNL